MENNRWKSIGAVGVGLLSLGSIFTATRMTAKEKDKVLVEEVVNEKGLASGSDEELPVAERGHEATPRDRESLQASFASVEIQGEALESPVLCSPEAIKIGSDSDSEESSLQSRVEIESEEEPAEAPPEEEVTVRSASPKNDEDNEINQYIDPIVASILENAAATAVNDEDMPPRVATNTSNSCDSGLHEVMTEPMKHPSAMTPMSEQPDEDRTDQQDGLTDEPASEVAPRRSEDGVTRTEEEGDENEENEACKKKRMAGFKLTAGLLAVKALNKLKLPVGYPEPPSSIVTDVVNAAHPVAVEEAEVAEPEMVFLESGEYSSDESQVAMNERQESLPDESDENSQAAAAEEEPKEATLTTEEEPTLTTEEEPEQATVTTEEPGQATTIEKSETIVEDESDSKHLEVNEAAEVDIDRMDSTTEGEADSKHIEDNETPEADDAKDTTGNDDDATQGTQDVEEVTPKDSEEIKEAPQDEVSLESPNIVKVSIGVGSPSTPEENVITPLKGEGEGIETTPRHGYVSSDYEYRRTFSGSSQGKLRGSKQYLRPATKSEVETRSYSTSPRKSPARSRGSSGSYQSPTQYYSSNYHMGPGVNPLEGVVAQQKARIDELVQENQELRESSLFIGVQGGEGHFTGSLAKAVDVMLTQGAMLQQREQEIAWLRRECQTALSPNHHQASSTRQSSSSSRARTPRSTPSRMRGSPPHRNSTPPPGLKRRLYS